MIDLRGKNTIVTGGGSGIGRGISRVFAEAGAHVHVVDKNGSDAAETSSSLSGTGEFTSESVDVTDVVTVESVVSRSISEFGKIDILVNNAGIVGAQNWWQRDIPNDADWHDVHEVNVRGMVRMSESVSQHMKNRRYGKIINIASIAARQGSPDLPHYSATKAAVVSWTQSNAIQLAPFNINVNAICPGLIWTPMWEAIARKREKFGGPVSDARGISGREIFERVVEQWIPMKREQRPSDIGNLAAFLASDLSTNITGQSINVDGGRFMN